MKRTILPLLAFFGLLFCSLNAYSQDFPVFQKGDVVINAGLGLGTTFSYAGTLGIPFGGGVEYGVTDNIGVGGQIGYAAGGGLTVLYIGARGSYHFNELLNLDVDNLDIYGGLDLMYRNFSWTGISFNIASGIQLGVHAGARYYFSEKFGVFGELGNSWGWLKAGVVLKL